MKFLHTNWGSTHTYRTTADSNKKIEQHNSVNHLKDSS